MQAEIKAAMLNRLTEIYNCPSSDRALCLSVIAMCMLHNIPDDEDFTRCSKLHQCQFCEQEVQEV